MDAADVKKTIVNLLNIRKNADKVIDNLNDIVERKEDALTYLLGSRKVTKDRVDDLRYTVKLEYRYLRYVAHVIEKAIENVSLIIRVWESGGKEISNTELGIEVVRYNLEFYQTALQELEEGHKLIIFFREHAEREQEFLHDAEKAKNSKEFGENYQRFWKEVKEELKARVEVSRLGELEEQAERLAEHMENLNRRFYAINYKRLVAATAALTPLIALIGWTFTGFGWQGALAGSLVGLGAGLLNLTLRLLRRKNIDILPY